MRGAGVLLPVFSLPGKYGIGSFSKEAYRFLNALSAAGQKYWQVLPLGPTGYGDSPYQSFSTFAGNPYFIDLEALIEEGLLSRAEVEKIDFGSDERRIDYRKLYENRYPLLRKAYERANVEANGEFLQFVSENADWIYDYALFMTIKEREGGKSFYEWPDDRRYRKADALAKARAAWNPDVYFYAYLQYLFFRQWNRLKDYAHRKGIRIIGDLPIYVARDSADVWTNPELFQTDAGGSLSFVGGCPPDYFSADGQLWGNPVYDWPYHQSTGYSWWIRRIQKAAEILDIIRIDHFRGLEAYYAIPAQATNGRDGHWEKGPGMDLFRAIRGKLGDVPIIAEDLGLMTDGVRKLVKDSGYPNMKVLEFAFTGDEASEHRPCSYKDTNTVVYTGTHDNETLKGYLEDASERERERIARYTGQSPSDIDGLRDGLIRACLSSIGDTAIVPLQDYLGLGKEARINTPSTFGENWQFRFTEEDFKTNIWERMREYAEIYNRI